MSYTCALSLKKIKDYLAGAAVVGFDFETSPIEEYRSEERAALDAHKAAITGVSLSVSEDSGIYIPLRHRAGKEGTGRILGIHRRIRHGLLVLEHQIQVSEGIPSVVKIQAIRFLQMTSTSLFSPLRGSALSMYYSIFMFILPKRCVFTTCHSFDR